MDNNKHIIMRFLEEIRITNLAYIAGMTNWCSIDDYAHLVREKGGKKIWTDALQQALMEHNAVMLPAAEEPYYIDASVRIPSNRHIEAAPDAVIRLLDGVKVLMLRNEHTLDGTHMPMSDDGRDVNISITGGRWEEYHEKRAGYGKSGMYDEERSFYGVSTCMLFNHIENLTLTNMTFAHTAAFAVQLGNAKNVVIENIIFDRCLADGIHINGNVENVLVRGIHGQVGDDLVALNMYDWQNSAVNFGPGKCIFCDDISSSSSVGYKSMRLEPGIYTYDDGSSVDCSLNDVVIRNVQGVHTFKLYFQTPSYQIGTAPEAGAPGSVSNIYFDDIDIDLSAPVDHFDEYVNSDPVRGVFGAFELGSNISSISFENIRLTWHGDKYPLSCLVSVGPKSIRVGDREIFDPYISNHVENIYLKDVYVNGEKLTETGDMVRCVRFEDVNGDGHSTGAGTIGSIAIE